jgi:von Willebrand factor type A domain
MTDSTSIMHQTTKDVDALKPPTADYIVVDGSGSMFTHWASSMQAIDAFVAELGNLSTKLNMTIFDNHHGTTRFVTARDCTPETWSRVSNGETQPLGGTTPLYDAINATGRMIRDANHPKPGSVLIVTDGDENASQTTQVQAKQILDWLRAKGWQITFIGCDFDNSRQASLLGGNKQSAIGVSSARLTNATTALARKRNLHAQFGAPMHWSEDDHQQFGGYLGNSK